VAPEEFVRVMMDRLVPGTPDDSALPDIDHPGAGDDGVFGDD
jgi:hypothetical protein